MRTFLNYRMLCLAAALALVTVASSTSAEETDAGRLATELKPFFTALTGNSSAYVLDAKVSATIEGKSQDVAAKLTRFDADSFDLDLVHSDYEVRLRRRADATAFALPKHKVVFVGKGKADSADCLDPSGICGRLVGSGCSVQPYVQLVTQSDAATASLLLTGLLKVKRDAATGKWSAGKDVTFEFGKESPSLSVTFPGGSTVISLGKPEAMKAVDAWDGLAATELSRAELERQLSRGVRRSLEILAPSSELTSPQTSGRRVAHGELRWVEGQRVAILSGTPEQVGRAHGELLKVEAQRCVDSVIYAFGTVQTINTGRWFRQDLEAAYSRLAPHIPADHKTEVRALAESMGWDPHLAEVVNVFPELFHCSGFAVFGSATADGKLYHGRVLDYMTTIGLQDAATTFIVSVDGKIPFANVGYAGFIGSVSGMNAKAVSLGEMGGRGEGKWDGVPMATLMRRALEECSTLDEVMDLWKKSPRTCEYYYVFADGKTNRAVGVAAVPESVDFILPGQSHERLGEGIPDAVVLSAGSRLEKLRERVKEKHGKIDVPTAQWLMSRPVAMSSNLHDVLFVPADGVLYVANADHRHPAAERPYVRLDLRELLKSSPKVTSAQAPAPDASR